MLLQILKKQATQKSGIVMHQTSYPQNNVPTNQQYLHVIDNPQTLTPTNKYDSTERVRGVLVLICNIKMNNPLLFRGAKAFFFKLCLTDIIKYM